jgi:ribosomal subunit interface protein
MEIHFKTAHAKDVEQEVTEKVTSLAQRKLIALKKYLGKTDGVTQVYVELGKISEAHQKGDVWRAQINLDSNGKRYHATATGEQLQSAIDASIHELESELRKAKQKNKSMLRRGGVAMKAFIRGFRTQ